MEVEQPLYYHMHVVTITFYLSLALCGQQVLVINQLADLFCHTEVIAQRLWRHVQPYLEVVMDNQSTGGFLSPENVAEDILDEVESESDEEITDEDKEAKRNVSLGTPDEYV